MGRRGKEIYVMPFFLNVKKKFKKYVVFLGQGNVWPFQELFCWFNFMFGLM